MNNSTLPKILSSINSTLNIVNKTVPIYKEAKPIITSAKNTIINIKNNKNDLSKIIKLYKLKNNIKKEQNIKEIKQINTNTYNINNPTFFI